MEVGIAGSTEPTDPLLANLRCDGVGPFWLQIRRVLGRMIASGAWAPGTRLPSELALAEHFGSSRMTTNRAILSLAAEGLVVRHRRIGTIVATRAQERPAFEIWDIREVITRGGGKYHYRLLDRQTVAQDDPRRDLFNVSGKVRLLWLRCLHTSDETPFQLEERLVNVEAAPGILTQPVDRVPPGPWLIDHVPWTQAEHTISALPAGPREAEALALGGGAPCLLVERRTWNGDVPVTLARLWHPGSLYRLKGRFEPVC